MKLCDVCQDNTETLVPLSEEYKTEHISEVCLECLKVMNKIILTVDAQVREFGKKAKNRGLAGFFKHMKEKANG